MHRTSHIVVILLVLIATVAVISSQKQQIKASAIAPASLVLLLPDSVNQSDPQVTVWTDALQEEGLRVTLMRDSDFLRPTLDRQQITGVILPDQAHTVATDILIDTLADYVERGGNLMLVFDAGVHTPANVYASNKARFARLAGIDYALYEQLKDRTTLRKPVLGTAPIFEALQVPPGKYTPYAGLPGVPEATPDVVKKFAYTITGYFEPALPYDVYTTQGEYRGEALLQTVSGELAAGQRKEGKGQVLFVNIPLGYLKGRTDGLLLHGFIRYFADHIVQLPYLVAVPNGTGGLIINLHLDSNAAFESLEKMKASGFFNQGPYSLHVSAGPDANEFGDAGGLNVPNNKNIRNWISYFVVNGYEIGSHGGWIHDYFARNVPDQPTEEFERYLMENKKTLEDVTGRPVREYSAPAGNHPQCVTGWLKENDVIAYYFVGNSGMAPTRAYRDGVLEFPEVWSFPILIHKWTTEFMEQAAYGFTESEVTGWLQQTADFSSRNNTVRMLYFHPRDTVLYPAAMRDWLSHTGSMQKQGVFRWYTMANVAEFLNQRNRVNWSVQQQDNQTVFTASHPDSLQKMTWALPKTIYGRPDVLEGKATTREQKNYWLLAAEDVKNLKFTTKRQ